MIKCFVRQDTGNAVMTAAAQLFLLFEKTELEGNVRAQDDPKWAAMVAALRDTTPGASPIRDHLIPILDSLVLSASDVRDDSEWITAPLCVSGNLHRMAIVHSRARQLALELGVPVVLWRLPISGSHAQVLDENHTNMLYDSDPRLWGYFIEGSDGHLATLTRTSSLRGWSQTAHRWCSTASRLALAKVKQVTVPMRIWRVTRPAY